MTTYQQALLLRLTAAQLANEEKSIIVLQRRLHDLYMTDLEIGAAVEALRAALQHIALEQAQFFDLAA